MTEIWKDIPGYDGFYSVSSIGHVRSNARTIVRSNGAILPIKTRILALVPDDYGYPVVVLCNKDKKCTRYLVHRLIMLTFVGPCPAGQEVLHGDGNAANCTLGNLRYGTHIENYVDQRKHGTSNKGEKNGVSILDKISVLDIMTRLNAGESHKDISKDFGVLPACIYAIKMGYNWNWLTKVNP